MLNEEDMAYQLEFAMNEKIGDKEEIQLFDELNLAMELDEDKNYDIVSKRVNNGIDFSITTPYPDGLPEKLGCMFFNVSTNFNVNIVETQQCASVGERYFKIKLNKL